MLFIIYLFILSIVLMVIFLLFPRMINIFFYGRISWKSPEDILPILGISEDGIVLDNGLKIIGYELLGTDIKAIRKAKEENLNNILKKIANRLSSFKFTLVQVNEKFKLSPYTEDYTIEKLYRKKVDQSAFSLKTYVLLEDNEEAKIIMESLPKDIHVKRCSGVKLASLAQKILSPNQKNKISTGLNGKNILFTDQIDYENNSGEIIFTGQNDEKKRRKVLSYAFSSEEFDTGFFKELSCLEKQYIHVIKVRPASKISLINKAKFQGSFTPSLKKKAEELQERLVEEDIFDVSSYVLYEDDEFFTQVSQSASSNYGTVWKERLSEPFLESIFPYRDDLYRKYLMTESGIASLLLPMFKNKGLKESIWNKESPICYFPTHQGSTYAFHMHPKEMGQDERVGVLKNTSLSKAHGAIRGGTGSGKSVMLTHLSLLMYHQGATIFAFDHDDGLYAPTKYAKGEHIAFDRTKAINPFQLPNDDEGNNIEFIKAFLKAMIDNKELENSSEIDFAARLIMYAKRENQNLKHLNELAFVSNPKLESIVKSWIEKGVFTKDNDVLEITDDKRFFTFDLTNLKPKSTKEQDPTAPLVMMYIMNKIYSYLIHREDKRKPVVIIIDEAASALRIPSFKAWLQIMYERFRKLGAAVITVFQMDEQMEEAEIVAHINQSQNRFIFSSEGLEKYGCTPELINEFKQTKLIRPAVLLRDDAQLIISTELDLSDPLGKIFHGKESADELKRLEDQHGEEKGFKKFIEG